MTSELTIKNNSLNLVKVIKKYDLFIILLLLLLSNYLLRWVFELHFTQLPYYFDQEHIDYHNAKWYTYMLPSMAKLWGGTWSSLGIGLFPLLKSIFGNTKSYLYLNLLFVFTAYVLSWFTFRSKILTITVGLCAAFTTLNAHVYQNSSLIIIYIPFIFCFLNMFAFYQLFQEKVKLVRWWAFWTTSLLLYLLSYEGWLDYYSIILFLTPFCLYILHKQQDKIRTIRLLKMISILTVFAIIYVILKINYGYASHKGDEHDLVINYGWHYFPLMIEDIITKLFTLFYSTIITYIPPIFSFSSSYLLYGPHTLIRLQNGYDSTNSYLAAINAVLLWRFYAGVYFAAFVYALVKVAKKVFITFNIDHFYIFIFMMMILIGSPTHLLIKFRPFYIVPWLSYQAFIGQIGLILLIGYGLKMLHTSSLNKKIIWGITLLIWVNIILCAYLKPPFYRAGVSYNHLGFKVKPL